MAYNQSVPATGHSGSQDYQDIQGNFVQIQTSFSVDHEPLASGGGIDGYHKKVTLAAPITDPNLAANVSSVYSKLVSSVPQLFFQNGALASNVSQLTGNAVLTGSEYTVVTPWGLILKFGLGTASNAGIVNNFAVAFPNTAAGILLTPRFAGALSVGANSLVVNGFTAYLQSGPGTQAIYYFAWGT